MPEVLTFEEALEHARDCRKRHLLLGNGFSIACRPKIFTYGSLFEQADFSDNPELPQVFEELGTTDFEQVIKALEDAAKAVAVFDPKATALARRLAQGGEALKDLLIRTVAGNHPTIPNEIEDQQFWACRRFLSHFLGTNNDGKVFTLNYDLLLYWTLMHDDMPFGDSIVLATNDGFGRDEDTEPEFVNWMGETGAHQQRVHYLHGALHLFDAGAEIQKYTWINTGLPLLDQARGAMAQDKFPLFVAEGTSDQKLAKIKHSAYLYHSYKSFSSHMEQRDQALFIFGHSLASNDLHVFKKLGRGKIKRAYVGLHGDPDSGNNKRIVAAAEALARQRSERYPLELVYYDTVSARVWEY